MLDSAIEQYWFENKTKISQYCGDQETDNQEVSKTKENYSNIRAKTNNEDMKPVRLKEAI